MKRIATFLSQISLFICLVAGSINVQANVLEENSSESELSAPENLIASQGTYLEYIDVSWDEVGGASHYEVSWLVVSDIESQDEDGRFTQQVYSTSERFRRFGSDLYRTFEIKACNSNGCSVPAEVTGYTALTAITDFSLSAEHMENLASSSGVWQIGGYLRHFAGINPMFEGTIGNRQFLDTRKDYNVESRLYLSSTPSWCNTLFDHRFVVQNSTYDRSNEFSKSALRLIYTGEGCEEFPDLEPGKLYLDSIYLKAPQQLTLDVNDLNNSEQAISLDVKNGNASFQIGDHQVQGDNKLSGNLFDYVVQTWTADNHFFFSLSLTTQGYDDYIPTSFFHFTAIEMHPEMARVTLYKNNLSGEFLVEVKSGTYPTYSSETSKVADFSTLNNYLYVSDIVPKEETNIFARVCQADRCSPYKVQKEQTIGYFSLEGDLNDVDFEQGVELGEAIIEFNANNSGRFFFDTITISRTQDNADFTDIAQLTIADILADGVYDPKQNKWEDKDLIPGNIYTYRVELCNPLDCVIYTDNITATADSDGDGVFDHLDLFPNDPGESADLDGDGIGDNSDPDKDGDGIADSAEEALGMDTEIQDAYYDYDADSYNNIMEIAAQSDPFDAESKPEDNHQVFTIDYSHSIDDLPPEFTVHEDVTYQTWTKFHGSSSLEIANFSSTSKNLFVNLDVITQEGQIWFALYDREYNDEVAITTTLNGNPIDWRSHAQMFNRGRDRDWYWVSIPVNAGENTLNFEFELAGATILLDAFMFKPGNIVQRAVTGDYDGDGLSDLAVRSTDTYLNYFLYSDNQDIGRITFGKNKTDIPVSGDFDGDGITDVAVRRPENYTWYVKRSSDNEISRTVLGKRTTDIPVPADYDGDGITDVAVRRPENHMWYIQRSSDGELIRQQFGKDSADIPVPADYDGDGKSDIAVRRPATNYWYILRSSDGQIQRTRFGLQSTDIPVPADYDGDGKADIAVRRANNHMWYILRSSDDQIDRIQFGRNSQDIPVPGDYDGDGITDIAVRRPDKHYWYILSSKTGEILRHHFGKNSEYVPYLAPVNFRMGATDVFAFSSHDVPLKFSLEKVNDVRLLKQFANEYQGTELNFKD